MVSPQTHAPLTLDQVGAAWLAGYTSSNTRAAYGHDLRAYLSWCSHEQRHPFAAPTEVVVDYREQRRTSGVSAATIARQFAALRAFYSVAEELGACPTNPFETRHPTTVKRSDTVVMTAANIDRLHASARGDARCAVLVRLLLGEGLRLSEALAIDHDQISGSSRLKYVQVQRHGRTISVELSAATSNAIDRLQRASTKSGPLLLAQARRAAPAERLTRFGADFLLKQAALTAGLDQPVSANVLRRTHAAISHEAGVHIDDIRDRMGHRDVRTTRRYLSPGQPEPTTT